MEEFEDNGCETPEQAARGDIPPQFATVVGSRVGGDGATVWLLTNDQPPFEPYEVCYERRNGLWHFDAGTGGFGVGTPDDVLARGAPSRLVLTGCAINPPSTTRVLGRRARPYALIDVQQVSVAPPHLSSPATLKPAASLLVSRRLLCQADCGRLAVGVV